MATILLSIIVAAALATAAYIMRTNQRLTIEREKLDNRLRTEFEKSKAAEENAEVLRKANEQLRADVDSKYAQIKILEDKVTEVVNSFQNNCRDLVELQSKYRLLTETKASLDTQLSQFQEKIEKSNEDYEYKISLLSAHNEELRTKWEQKQNELTDMRAELGVVSSQFNEERNIHIAVREKAEIECNRLLAVNEELCRKMEILQINYESCIHSKRVLEEDLVEKRILIEALHNQISSTEAKIDSKDDDIKKLIERAEELANNVQDRQSIIDRQFEGACKLREEINELKNEKVIRDSAFKNIEADSELKKETINFLEEENKSLKEKIDTREEDINDLNQRIRKLGAEKSELEARIKILEGHISPKQPAAPPTPKEPSGQHLVPQGEREKRELGAGGVRGQRDAFHRQERPLGCHLLCWKADGAWSVGIELLSLTDDLAIEKVLQREIPLKRDDSREICWLLNNLRDDIDISWVSNGSHYSKTVTIANDLYLFILHGDYLDYGRHCRQLRRSATTLMILSNDWKVADEYKNSLGLGEQVTIDDYTAYYINSLDDTHDHIKLINRYDYIRKLAIDQPSFLLEGNRIRNDDRNSCPIFGGGLPVIRICKGSTWKDISTILIGEEGPGRKRWHGKFMPIIDKQLQQIPQTVEGVKISNGWYYLRFYDQNYNFIESLDFLYVASINEIKTLGSFFPKEQGHTAEEIQFHHSKDCMIISKSHPDRLIPEHTHYGTVVRIPPQSCYDVTKWAIVDSNSRQHDVTIELDRVWWALGYETIFPQSWTDKFLEVSLENFNATSERCLWVKFPRKEAHMKSCEISAGFSNLTMYAFKTNDNMCLLPLRIYGDSIFNHNKMGKLEFILCCESQSRSVLTLQVKGKCLFCEHVEHDEYGMLTHFRMTHKEKVSDDSFYRQLTYSEIRKIKQYSHIPSAVYKCAYCDHCVDADDRSKSPTSAILRHFESDNADVCKASKASKSGFRVPSFGVMTDVNVINTIMDKNLPIIYSCTACGRDIYECNADSKENRLEHIIQKHKNRLFTLL